MSRLIFIPRLILSALVLTGCFAHAGALSLDQAQSRVLRSLVATDAEAAAQYRQLRKKADAAMADVPNPVIRVVSEGRLESDPEKVRTTASLEDMEKVEALAWVALVSEEQGYAAKAREFILAWARVNQSDGNPINETKFEPLIEAYDLLKEGFSPSERRQVNNWLREKAVSTWNSPKGQKENWHSHRLKTVGLVAAVLEDNRLWNTVHEGYRQHLEANFEVGGVSVDFKRRDAMHYHLYAVQPLLTLACVARQRGEPWFNYQASTGASLRQAVDFIKPYALGEKQHVEFANSQVKFDRARAQSGEKEYGQHYWSPKQAVRVFSEAGCLDPNYDDIALTVADKGNKKFLNWRAVLNAASAAKPAH